MKILKEPIYVKGVETRRYITQVHKFDDKLCLTVLSLMYPTIALDCYSPIDFDVFIYKFDSEKKETQIVRTHIYNGTIDIIQIHLIEKIRSFSMLNIQK